MSKYFDPKFLQVDRVIDANYSIMDDDGGYATSIEMANRDPKDLPPNFLHHLGSKDQRSKVRHWQDECGRLLSTLCKMKREGMKIAQFFLAPVDEERDQAPGYFDIITEPRDMGTIGTKLREGGYQTPTSFLTDLRLVWSNALRYNSNPQSMVRWCAEILCERMEKIVASSHLLRTTTETAGTGKDEEAESGSRGEESSLMKSTLTSDTRNRNNNNNNNNNNHKNKKSQKNAAISSKPRLCLVKWQGLGYDDCTWENEQNINDDLAISTYHSVLSQRKAKRQLLEQFKVIFFNFFLIFF